MNNIKLNGIGDEINCSNITIEETVNGVDANLLQELYGLRDNIQNQIDNISAGITTDTNLNINSLTTASTINASGNIQTTANLRRTNLTITDSITCDNFVRGYSFVQRGTSLDDLLLTKQQKITKKYGAKEIF
jgi:hypothetical protein